MVCGPSLAPVVVLVVEDEPIIRMSAVDALTEGGFQIVEAANADEAVPLLEARMDIRIVFTDIDMPGSMNGLTLAAAIRGRWPPVEIVLTSGHLKIALGDLPERCLFIPKPYSTSHVIATLREIVA